MKTYLAAYDYGQGGVWAFLRAESREAIESRYTDVVVVDAPPGWMTAEFVTHLRETMTFDVGDPRVPFPERTSYGRVGTAGSGSSRVAGDIAGAGEGDPSVAAKKTLRGRLPVGPVDYVVIAFRGDVPEADLVRALSKSIDLHLTRILDLVLIRKHADGHVSATEFESLSADAIRELQEVQPEYELLSEDDVLAMAEQVEPNSSAAVLVFESLWWSRFADAFGRADGVILTHGQVLGSNKANAPTISRTP